MSREPVMDKEANDITEHGNGDECRQHRQPSVIGLTNVHRRWCHPEYVVIKACARHSLRRQRHLPRAPLYG
jgi:hypothetical protein